MGKTEELIKEISNTINPGLRRNETVSQIEKVFRKHGFYTTREYLFSKMKDDSSRSGRIDLVARKGKFRVALEYDHHKLIKWKSFQKILQINPEVAIAITGGGSVGPNIKRASKYRKIQKAPRAMAEKCLNNYARQAQNLLS